MYSSNFPNVFVFFYYYYYYFVFLSSFDTKERGVLIFVEDLFSQLYWNVGKFWFPELWFLLFRFLLIHIFSLTQQGFERFWSTAEFCVLIFYFIFLVYLFRFCLVAEKAEKKRSVFGFRFSFSWVSYDKIISLKISSKIF